MSLRQTSLITGINRRNFSTGIVRRLSLDARSSNAFWAICGKAKRRDALLAKVCTMVSKFWYDNTRISPIAKDIVRKRVAAKDWITHPAHHLMESQVRMTMGSCLVYRFRVVSTDTFVGLCLKHKISSHNNVRFFEGLLRNPSLGYSQSVLSSLLCFDSNCTLSNSLNLVVWNAIFFSDTEDLSCSR